jgi:membrane-associated phospholipid phosphatase
MPAIKQPLIAIWMTLLVAGFMIAVLVHGAGPIMGDLVVTRTLQQFMPKNSVIGGILAYARDVVWFVPIAAVLVAALRRHWAAVGFILLASLTTLLISELVLKSIVARPRPSAALVQVYEGAGSYSFPSSTALFGCVLLGVVCYLVWQAQHTGQWNRSVLEILISVMSLLLLAMNGVSRVWVGAHWLSDVVGSWLFGGAWLLVLVAAYRWWQRQSI